MDFGGLRHFLFGVMVVGDWKVPVWARWSQGASLEGFWGVSWRVFCEEAKLPGKFSGDGGSVLRSVDP